MGSFKRLFVTRGADDPPPDLSTVIQGEMAEAYDRLEQVVAASPHKATLDIANAHPVYDRDPDPANRDVALRSQKDVQ